MKPPRLSPGTRAVVALGLAGGLLVAGCGKGGYNGSLAPTTTAAASTASGPTATTQAVAVPAAAKAALLAAYHGYWDALIAAGKTADASNPALARFATGAALSEARSHFAGLKQAGQVDLGTVALHPTIVSVAAKVASIQDCADTTHWLRRDAATGALRETPATAPEKDTVVLLLTDGTWKVSYVTRKGTCAS
jgi:hypothetical protein